MKHLESIYRSYDIRGEYPNEIHEDEVYKIGSALVTKLGFKKVAIGKDVRPSGDILFEALANGVQDQGGDVIDLGLITTPMSYFAGRLDVDATAMITASHMPSQYNGIKICRGGNEPLDPDVLKEIESYVKERDFNPVEETGKRTQYDIKPEWQKFFTDKFDFSDSNFKIVVDPANMIGILEIETFKKFEPHISVQAIYDEFDHRCPNHEANPVKFETLEDLGEEVKNTTSDLGIAFDGDADRVGFVDEDGEPIPSDVIGIIIASHLIATGQGTDVVYTLNGTKSVVEVIAENGGTAHESVVGSRKVKKIMREKDAMLGIELSGHFFFKETAYTEGGILPALYVLAEMKRRSMKLSELRDEIVKYHRSGEINSQITLSIEEIFSRLRERYSEGSVNDMDGLKIVFENWWFNVRPSANDPVMRLNLEADTEELMKEKTDEVLEVIRASE